MAVNVTEDGLSFEVALQEFPTLSGEMAPFSPKSGFDCFGDYPIQSTNA